MFVYDIKVYNDEAKLIRHNKMLSDHMLSKLEIVSGTSGQWRKVCCSCTYKDVTIEEYIIFNSI